MNKLDRLVPYSKKRYEKMRREIAEAEHPELPLKENPAPCKQRRRKSKQLEFWK